MRFITEGGKWESTLQDGSVVRVWADGYHELGDYYDFGILVDVEGNLGATLVVTSRTLATPAA